MRRWRSGQRLALRLAVGAALLPLGAPAQIRTDGSLGRAATALSGPNYQIPESLGRLAGPNLLHSFQTFGLASGESATFSTTSTGIANVIGRVTGGAPSQINGRIALAAAAGTPALFLINPAGIVFGAGASLDVPGAFHASTAQQLRLADGSVLAIDSSAPSSFSAAAPEAFGFLGGARAPLQVVDGARLVTGTGHAMSLVGGDVALAGNALVGKVGGAGELRLVAVGAAPAAIPLTGTLPAVHGNLEITGNSLASVVNAGPEDAGALRLAGGAITIADTGAALSSTLAGGKAADVVVQASGLFALRRGGLIDANTRAEGAAGRVLVQAGQVVVDGQDNGFTGILSSALPGSTANSGDIEVVSGGDLTVTHGAINSSSYGAGDGGNIRVTAENIRVDGQGVYESLAGISSIALPLSTGRAGSLDITARGDLLLVNRGMIDSSSSSPSDAGSIRVSARNITIDGGDFGYSAISSVSFTSGRGRAGDVQVRAQGDLALLRGGQIDSSTYSDGDAGSVQVAAHNVLVDGTSGSGTPASIFSVSSPISSGHAGEIEVTASGRLSVLGPASIDSSVYFDGDGGSVKVRAADIVIDAQGALSGGIRSATWASAGRASSSVDVQASGSLQILRGGVIDTSTYGGAAAGAIRVAAGDITIDGQGMLSGIFSSSGQGATGKGGNVEVVATRGLTLRGRGEIDSTTYTRGDAGSVKVVTDALLIDGGGDDGLFSTGIFSESAVGSGGHAGSLDVTARSVVLRHGGMIDSSTFGSGNAGAVHVRATDIVLDGQELGFASIASSAFPGSRGQAGGVDVVAERSLALASGGRIETATYGAGAGGAVHVQAQTIRIDGAASSINASARQTSQGQPGNVEVRAGESVWLGNGGRLAIQNDAQADAPAAITPASLRVVAPSITLESGARITAQATGNVQASNIELQFTDRLRLDHASITTSAQDGDGGAILVAGGRLVDLRQSQITTSVLGSAGNGGNIALAADALVMRSGFIQANTAADAAIGGDVRIDVGSLIPSGSSLFVGGALAYAFRPELFGFNVIQAAAPTGVSGAIAIAAPALDISGSLSGLAVPLLQSDGLARSPCQPGGRSFLTAGSHGGLAPSARGWLGPAPPAGRPAAAGASDGGAAVAARAAAAECAR